MRITAGIAKGTRLSVPKTPDMRPTTDKTKEAVFSSIGPLIEDKSVADVFAGSGALGLEALSRGASYCVFIENNKTAVKTIQNNARSAGFESNFQVIHSDAAKWVRRERRRYGLIFADPPYVMSLQDLTLLCNDIQGLLDREGVFILEYTSRSSIPQIENLELFREKTYGDTRIGFYRKP